MEFVGLVLGVLIVLGKAALVGLVTFVIVVGVGLLIRG